ncbi:MAG: hypothetical protein ACK4NC_04315 [Candidatus Gracilibacteria bacterium]
MKNSENYFSHKDLDKNFKAAQNVLVELREIAESEVYIPENSKSYENISSVPGVDRVLQEIHSLVMEEVYTPKSI